MRCERLDSLLPAYIDGDLPGRLNALLSDHLDRCERCRQELAAQQRVLRALDAGRRPVAIDLWSDFSRRLAESESGRPSAMNGLVFRRVRWRLPLPDTRFLWQPGLATALAAVVVALIASTGPEFVPVPAGAHSSASGVQMAQAPVEQPQAREAVERPVFSARKPTGQTLKSMSLVRLGSERRNPWSRPSQPRTVQTASNSGPTRDRTDEARRIQRGQERRSSSVRLATQADVPAAAPAASPTAPPLLESTDSMGPSTYRLATTAGATLVTTSDPLNIAEALVAAQQDAANDQMAGELLRLAQEVVRVSGEPAADAAANDGSRT